MESAKRTGTIFISGYFGRGNTGDEILLSGMLSSLRKEMPAVECCVSSGDPAETELYHRVQAVPFWDMSAVSDAIQESSLVIIGGGGLFQDYWEVDLSSYLTMRAGGITEYGSPLLLAAACGIPVMLYSVGVGPLKTRQGKDEVRRLAGMADVLSVRDEQSRQLLGVLGCDMNRISVDPDPAYFHPGFDTPAGVCMDLQKPVLGVSLRSWDITVRQGQWQDEVAKALDCFLHRTGGSVLFVPFQENGLELENDRLACNAVHKRMKARELCSILQSHSDPFSRFASLQTCDVVLGMRMHAALAAIAAGVPAVGLAYDPKVTALLSQAGLEDYAVPLEEVNAESLGEILIHAWNKRDRISSAMKGWSDHVYRQGSTCASKAIQLLQAAPARREDGMLCQELLLKQVSTSAALERERVRLDRLMEEKTKEIGKIREKTEVMGEMIKKRTELLVNELEVLRGKNTAARNQILDLQNDLDMARGEAEESEIKLKEIQYSRGFKFLNWLWRIFWILRKPASLLWIVRPKLLSLWTKVRKNLLIRSGFLQDWMLQISPAWFRQLQMLKRISRRRTLHSDVVLYTGSNKLFPEYTNRCKIKLQPKEHVRVSWVTTVKNECSNAQDWLKQLEQQTRLPEEILILDGGSTDGTMQILEAYAANSPLPIHVHSFPGRNIASRRNIGVRISSCPVIAMTDFGCILEPDWLEKIAAPFEDNNDIQVSAGWYCGEANTWLGRSACYELIPHLENISPDTFIPACRSIAFRREVWKQAGGFPEWLTKTGEDTWFGLKLKRAGIRWAFVPDAVVRWHAPETLSGIWKKLYSWSTGDGESGGFADRYCAVVPSLFLDMLMLLAAFFSLFAYPVLGILYVLLLVIGVIQMVESADQDVSKPTWIWRRVGAWARVTGFIKGFRKRQIALSRRTEELEGVVFLLSGVPFDDTGGGARGTQIALEYLERNYFVVFLHEFPRQESVDLDLDTDLPFLLHRPLAEFDMEVFRREYGFLLEQKQIITWIEFPLPSFYPFMRKMKKEGASVVYDLIDNWQSSLGGEWYSEETEAKIAADVDLLFASASDLQQRLEAMSGKEAALLPNAYNARLFDRACEYERPHDLPYGDHVYIYIGALWGEWFDWDLLLQTAEQNPGDAVVVIGDYVGQCEPHPENLHFLGLKPQISLPAYLAYADAGLLPWKTGPITQATSPLKVYEYLAMGVPVVAPGLQPLHNLPFVFCAHNRKEFLELLHQVVKVRPDGKVLDDFLQCSTWQARIDQVQALLGNEQGKVAAAELIDSQKHILQAKGTQRVLSI